MTNDKHNTELTALHRQQCKRTVFECVRYKETESFRSAALGLQQGPYFTTSCVSGFVVALLHVSVDVGANLCDDCSRTLQWPLDTKRHAFCISCSQHQAPLFYMTRFASPPNKQLCMSCRQSRWTTESPQEGSILDLLPVLYCISQLH